MTDVVDVLVAEHQRMRQLSAEVLSASPADKRLLFAKLERLVTAHETGERNLVHPAARDSSATAVDVVLACMAQEGRIERDLAGLKALGVDDPGFDEGFGRLRQAILDHNAREEREEFPLLRLFVRAQRLHMMVGQLHDFEVMAGR